MVSTVFISHTALGCTIAISSYSHTQSCGSMLSEQMPIKLFYIGNYQTLGDKLYVCSIRDFYAKNSGSKWLREQVMGRGCHFQRFLSNTCPTQIVKSVRIKPKLVHEFFTDGWLLLWWGSFGYHSFGFRVTKTHFFGLKFFLNDATMAIMLSQ